MGWRIEIKLHNTVFPAIPKLTVHGGGEPHPVRPVRYLLISQTGFHQLVVR